jgi:hypothetical protein
VANDKLKMDRSAEFLRIGGAHFLITASHELDKRIEGQVPLCIALQEGDFPFVVPAD